MIKVKDHQTAWIFDPWSHLGPKRLNLLEKSWPFVFRKYIFEKLPIDMIAKHFNVSIGSPTKELYTVVGALILQQLHDLSDSDVTLAVAFNIDWHYALDITDNSDESTYLSERTVRRYRKISIEDGIDRIMFDRLTDTLIDKFGVNTFKQRLDSTHIRSNMRILSQMGIFLSTIQKFLKKLRRNNAELYALLPDFGKRYLDKDSENMFSQVKPSTSSKTIHEIAKDILYLVELFHSNDIIRKLPEYRLLERILNESCSVTGKGIDKTVELKPFKEISPDSLQNPSDSDAGYDAHKGSGYQAQVMETYKTDKQDKTVPDLITHIDVEPANIHDSHAVIPAICATSQRNCQPDELVCDSLYGSDNNVRQAAEKNIEIIAPIQGNPHILDITLDKFEVDIESHFITRCPEGSVPANVRRTKKNKIIAKFTKNICCLCPRLNDCPVVIGKKASYLRYDDKILRLAQRRAYENSKEFKDKYRWRAGIEATMSHLKADVGLKRLRVRGLASVRFVVILKALSLNILRCAKTLRLLFVHHIFRLWAFLATSLVCFYTLYVILLSKNFYHSNNRLLIAF